MADVFLQLSAEDRRDALSVVADRSGRPTHLLEKDVWVVWALATLYAAPLGEHLVFKGGTSLSIRRTITTPPSRSVRSFSKSICQSTKARRKLPSPN